MALKTDELDIAISAPSNFGEAIPEKIVLIADATELLSGAVNPQDGVTLTALVTDSNNRLLEGVNVNFISALVSPAQAGFSGAGTLSVTRATTDATGTAVAQLGTGGNPRGRVISVSASADGFPDATAVEGLEVSVVGTRLQASGPLTLGANQRNVGYAVSLVDSSGRGIAAEDVTLSIQNPGETTQIVEETDAAGNVQFDIDASQVLASAVTLRFSAFDAESSVSDSIDVEVKPVEVGFVVEDAGFDIDDEPGGDGTGVVPLPPGVADDSAYTSNSEVEVPLERCLVATIEVAPSQLENDAEPVVEEGQFVQVSSSRGRIYADLESCRNEDVNGLTAEVELGEERNNGADDPCILGPSCFRSTAVLRSDGEGGAGPAVFAATHTESGATARTRADDTGLGPRLFFLATEPDRVIVQSNPSTVPVSGNAQILATVLDASNNVVANRVVDFRVEDPTGGGLLTPNSTTNRAGIASVTYAANSISSALEGVLITASVRDTEETLEDTTRLTVGGSALRISIGTGNDVTEVEAVDGNGDPIPGGFTAFDIAYTVIVTDSAGNPAPEDTEVRIRIESEDYQKGCYVVDAERNVWVPVYLVEGAGLQDPASLPCGDLAFYTSFGPACPNEDIDRDGILDLTEDLNGNGILDVDAGEDINGNGVLDTDVSEDIDGDGRLDPGAVTAVDSTVVLNDNGVGFFNITYPQDVANWLRVRLSVEAAVQGSESIERRTFVLPALADDIANTQASPPAFFSPFGVQPSCAVDG